MKKYNHAYTLAFSVDTDRTAAEHVSREEIICALLDRIVDLTRCDEWDEALGAPFDSYENEPDMPLDALQDELGRVRAIIRDIGMKDEGVNSL